MPETQHEDDDLDTLNEGLSVLKINDDDDLLTLNEGLSVLKINDDDDLLTLDEVLRSLEINKDRALMAMTHDDMNLFVGDDTRMWRVTLATFNETVKQPLPLSLEFHERGLELELSGYPVTCWNATSRQEIPPGTSMPEFQRRVRAEALLKCCATADRKIVDQVKASNGSTIWSKVAVDWPSHASGTRASIWCNVEGLQSVPHAKSLVKLVGVDPSQDVASSAGYQETLMATTAGTALVRLRNFARKLIPAEPSREKPLEEEEESDVDLEDDKFSKEEPYKDWSKVLYGACGLLDEEAMSTRGV